MGSQARRTGFQASGEAGWHSDTIATWRGGADDTWWHKRALMALDFVNGRALRGQAQLPLTSTLALTRDSRAWVADVSGVWQNFADNVLAQIDGTGAALYGAWVNKIRNPRGEGGTVGVVGADGALPANWTRIASGLIYTFLGSGTEDGLPYVDLSIAGTASGGATTLAFEPDAGSAFAAPGQAWGFDLHVKYLAVPLAAADAVQIDTQEFTAAGSFLTNVPAFITVSTTRARKVYKKILSNAGVARVKPVLVFRTTSGVAYDFSVRIYAPKLVQLAVMSGSPDAPGFLPGFPILPAVGAPSESTRAADVATVPGSDVWAASRLDAGASVLVDFDLSQVDAGEARTLFEYGDGSADNLAKAFIGANGKPSLLIVSAGVTQVTCELSAGVGPAASRFAFGWTAGGGYITDQAGNVADFGAVTMPVELSRLQIGGSLAGQYFNDSMKQTQVCLPMPLLEAKAWAAAV